MTNDAGSPPWPRRPRAAWMVALAGAVALGAAGSAAVPTAAVAGAPPCPSPGAERVPVTWGGPSAAIPLSEAGVTSGVRLLGLAAGGEDRRPSIRTRRDADGKGTAVLCVAGRIRARLPRLTEGRAVQAASVNGRYLAWRQTATQTRDAVVRGVVRNGRLHDLRRTTIPVSDRDRTAGDLRIVAHANGTVAWALDGPVHRGTPSTRAWVWPRGGRVRRVRIGTEDAEATNLRVLDDQHVLLGDSATPLRYAPARPGACPRLIDAGPYRELAGWRTAHVAGWSTSDDAGYSSTDWDVVCDPRSGRYVDVVAGFGTGFKGDGGRLTTTHVVRSGAWMLASQDAEGSVNGDHTVVKDVTTGRAVGVEGRVAGPGVVRPPGPDDARARVVGAVVGPGFVAFVRMGASPTATRSLVLADAVGTRVVATGAASGPGAVTGLVVDGDTLRWSVDGTPGAAPIVRAPGAPYAVVQPDRRRRHAAASRRRARPSVGAPRRAPWPAPDAVRALSPTPARPAPARPLRALPAARRG